MLLCIQSTTSSNTRNRVGHLQNKRNSLRNEEWHVLRLRILCAFTLCCQWLDHNFIRLLKADNKSRDFLSLRVTYRPSGAVGVNVTQRTTTPYVLRSKFPILKVQLISSYGTCFMPRILYVASGFLQNLCTSVLHSLKLVIRYTSSNVRLPGELHPPKWRPVITGKHTNPKCYYNPSVVHVPLSYMSNYPSEYF